jgi:hypothetical protein
MQLRVGPFIYQVRWVEDYIDYAGQRCLGLCDNEQHELIVSTQTGPMQQVQVLCHEYMEAWVYHFAGEKPTKEDYCDLFGLAMTQLVDDFAGATDAPADDQAPAQAQTLAQHLTRFADQMHDAAHRDDQANDPRPNAEPSPEITRAVSVHNPDSEHTAPARPGSPRPWRVRIFEPPTE